MSVSALRDPRQSFQQLADSLYGEVILPGYTGYEEARNLWNGLIDRYPAAIARCRTRSDVVTTLGFARSRGLPIAVRGGGHSVAGHGTCEAGLVIDLAPLKHIDVDPEQCIARVGGGALLGELDAATQRHGLATPSGVFTKTGIAGLTLGGGFGWLRNKYGLSCDNLIGAEMVTADGRIVRANAEENADLLWGLRGGGGNFGVVTTFEFQLHPVGPEVMFAFVFHDGRGERMAEAIRFYRDYSAEAPDEVSTLMACGVIPPEPELFPAEIHTMPFVLFGGLYAGPVAEGKRALQPLLDFGEPLVDHSGVMPYVDAQKAFDEDYPRGMRYYWKSLNLSRLDDEVIDRIVAHARRQVSPFSTTDIWHVGGAVRRMGSEQSAFHGREAAFLLSPAANWENPADDKANIGWLRDFIADMEPFSDGGRYLNFAGFQEEGDRMIRAAFGPQYPRLAALKAKYDPGNVFRLNQNIKPAKTR